MGWTTPAPLHHNCIDYDAMEPGREGGLSLKAVKAEKHLDESILREIFRFHDVAGHPQAEGMHLSSMQVIEFGKGSVISFFRAKDERENRIGNRWGN